MASPLASKNAPVIHPGDILIVIHDFDARSPDELTLRKSERVELIELDDGFGDGWYLGKHLAHGGTGLFPGVYTTKAPSTTRGLAHHSRQSSSELPGSPISNYSTVTTADRNARITSAPISANAKELPSLPEMSALNTTVPAASNSITNSSPRSSLPAAHHSTYVQRSIGEALGGRDRKSDSPVMNETLTVINEHITDMSTPRQSLAPPREGDSESDYSRDPDQNSYVAGPETDEEDNEQYDESVVRRWDHLQTAQHLRELGVDSRHCDIFRDQEISGDVLLDMDQGFIYMKEYDFGVMGRRLKTWHKIRDFQRSVKGPSRVKLQDNTQQAEQTTPKMEAVSAMPQPLQPQVNTTRAGAISTPPTSWRASVAADSPTRPDPGGFRESNHSRRHSSIDFGKALNLGSISESSQAGSQDIRPGSVAATTPTYPTQLSTIRPNVADNSTNSMYMASPVDLDRGYFSGNEVENRKIRSKVSKRESTKDTSKSRQSTALDPSQKRLPAIKRHSRLSSVDSIHEPLPLSTRAAKVYHNATSIGRFRTPSTRISSVPTSAGTSPTVTNLEGPQQGGGAHSNQDRMSMQDRARKLIGLRATSDAVTNNEKVVAGKTGLSVEPTKNELHSPTVSTTPSLTSRSVDMDDSSSKGTDPAILTPPQKTATRTRPKGKQQTSAYTHGLLKVTPAEARKACDYSGWMKKKSSGLMTTWKPRLFILKGRRLSYYYSENDTEERGIIDISGHKVLVANNDPITTLHATVTGAASKQSPSIATSGETSPTLTKSPAATASAPFFFKLVPPKTGLSRAVQFTKPTIHYFQVDSINEGRKWMGEIMKATITHDLTSFETTNKQKTISLAKARARRERPPALDDTKGVEEGTEDTAATDAKEKTEGGGGLNIQGLTLSESINDISLTEALGIGLMKPEKDSIIAEETTPPKDEKALPKSPPKSPIKATHNDEEAESNKENIKEATTRGSFHAATTAPTTMAS